MSSSDKAEGLVDAGKWLASLPGATWAFLLASAVLSHVVKDAENSTRWSTTANALTLLGLVLVAHVASSLVFDPLYECLYNADKPARSWVPWRARLDAARNKATKRMFAFDPSVDDYQSARKYVEFGKSNLGTYKRAVALAKQAGYWEGLPKFLLEGSKACRTLSLLMFLVLALGMIHVGDIPWTELGRRWVSDSMLATACIGFGVLGLAMRPHHQIALYEAITPYLGHVRLHDGHLMIVLARAQCPSIHYCDVSDGSSGRELGSESVRVNAPAAGVQG